MAVIRAIVTPKMMKWARERAHLSIEDAARKIGVSSTAISTWESGHTQPTVLQAKKAADVYGRPFAVLYLDSPPRDFDLIRDFRQLPGALEAQYSYALTMLIREMQDRQDWVRGIRRELDFRPLGFVRSTSLRANPISVANGLRDTLGVREGDERSWPTMNSALNAWVDRTESVGVFVCQTSVHGALQVEDARGFALVDEYAPFVFVNPKDSIGARIFTLAHELAHIWLGTSGVSGESFAVRPDSDAGRIERFCNRVASHIVLPDGTFDRCFSDLPAGTEIAHRIQTVAQRLKISRDVVARRLLDKGDLTEDRYRILHRQYIDDWRAQQKKRPSGGNYYVNHVRALSKSLVRLVGEVYSRGRITAAEASGLLNAKVERLSNLMRVAHSGSAD